jgi:hypothetical protein
MVVVEVKKKTGACHSYRHQVMRWSKSEYEIADYRAYAKQGERYGESKVVKVVGRFGCGHVERSLIL